VDGHPAGAVPEGRPFPETLFGRKFGCTSYGAWEYEVRPLLMEVEEFGEEEDEIIEDNTEPDEFVFSLSVRFPRTDLPLILERLRAAPRP
jgi:hypothetical protein